METGLHYNGYRYYDPGTWLYTESDPSGLRGGINTYVYVEGNPLDQVDPLGLFVNWSGTGKAVAGVAVVGAGYFQFDLTSDSVNGKRVHVIVLVAALGAGVGFTYTGSGSAESFHDYRDVLDPNVFNGGFGNIAASSVFGAGGSLGKTRLGHAWTSTGLSGPVYGLDFSAGAFIGRSFVSSSDETTCGCGSAKN